MADVVGMRGLIIQKAARENKIDPSKCPKMCPVPSRQTFIQRTAAAKKIERMHRAVVQLFSLQVSVHPLPCFQYAIALCTWPGMELISFVLLFRDSVGHRHDTVQQILPAAVCRKDSRYSPAFICNTIL